MPKSIKENQQGFVSIIALGIFAVLVSFGIIMQSLVIDTVASIKNTNNFYSARDLADSMIEKVRYDLNFHQAGYNNTIKCLWPIPFGQDNVNTDTICKTMSSLIGDKPVKMDVKVIGRGVPAEANLKTDNCPLSAGFTSFNTSCYTVPYPGTGSAGARCSIYPIGFNSNGEASTTIPTSLTGFTSEIDQIDYSCNWNKLTFGASLSDRVTIPLYYEASDGTIINPYATGDAKAISVRLRTPCIPKSDSDSSDPTVCADTDRYVLDISDGDDIVVQWQLSGIKDGEEVSYVGNPVGEEKSVLSEGRINGSISDIENKGQFSLIRNDSNLILTETNQSTGVSKKLLQGSTSQLSLLSKPVLTLFLSEGLSSINEKNVPYLEYQIVTDVPIADSRTQLIVEVGVDGNKFEETVYIEQQKPIIDFAIQN
ncbi:hypothetical protein JKY72_07135 [Candidatus Gracilibacteria bacterium]|nr:hypothetical protein [Candidatus Gracilibacteria bacterium]